MSGITSLATLLDTMAPELLPGDVVFCTVPGKLADYLHLEPLASFREKEGLSLIIDAQTAHSAKLPASSLYRQITLNVHSSLEAVGLTAAIAAKLSEHGISANVVAAYFHDHIFVPKDKAQLALDALSSLSS
ncbi:ACT domain-containing protein [Gallaecimonas mangrovi]|uniref:ACT domain-containing protein n=1 Tax=Gallaecimonas mangrovi TaxID=2291597 RepID=UPI000E20A055|nr:ACT domain-containing protein [Gallaecimonas mangrovi]